MRAMQGLPNKEDRKVKGNVEDLIWHIVNPRGGLLQSGENAAYPAATRLWCRGEGSSVTASEVGIKDSWSLPAVGREVGPDVTPGEPELEVDFLRSRDERAVVAAKPGKRCLGLVDPAADLKLGGQRSALCGGPSLPKGSPVEAVLLPLLVENRAIASPGLA